MGLVNSIFFMTQYILIVTLSLYVVTLGGGASEAGLAMTAFQAGTILCRPFAGRMVDALPKKKLMGVVTFLTALVMAGFFFADSLSDLCGLRLFHGILFSIGTTASATMAALALPAGRKGEGIGYFALSGNLAMVVGPMIGLFIAHTWGMTAVFGFLVAIVLIALSAVLFQKMPETPSKERTSRSGFSLRQMVEKKAIPASILGALIFFAYGGVLTFIPIYADSFGLQQETPVFFLVFALSMVVTRPLVGYVFDHMGPAWVLLPGFVSFALGFVFFAHMSTVLTLLFSGFLLGLGFGALSPGFQTLAILSVKPERIGAATATYFWSQDISVGAAALTLGWVAEKIGFSAMYEYFCLPAVLLAAAYFIFIHKFKYK